jgi:hypothetical protein
MEAPSNRISGESPSFLYLAGYILSLRYVGCIQKTIFGKLHMEDYVWKARYGDYIMQITCGRLYIDSYLTEDKWKAYNGGCVQQIVFGWLG